MAEPQLLAAVAVAVALVAAPPARAAYAPVATVQDEGSITCGTPDSRARALAVARSLSVSTVRLNAYENHDPMFGCRPVEAARAVAAAGMRPQVTVIGTPRFARMLARQIGPIVTTWAVWNEPNHPGFHYGPMASGRPTAYRRLYVKMARSIRKVDRGAKVLFGELAPGEPGTFTDRAFDGARRAVRADGFAIHPYVWLTPPGQIRRGPKGLGLRGYLREWAAHFQLLARTGTFCRQERSRPANRRRCRPVPIYVTEFGYLRESVQQKRADQIRSTATVVRWLPEAWRVACLEGVRQMNQYHLLDGRGRLTATATRGWRRCWAS